MLTSLVTRAGIGISRRSRAGSAPVLRLALSLAAFAAVVLTFAAAASGNDFVAGGTPADLLPISESRITMKSEDIVMEYRDGVWQVTADYVFVNSSKESVEEQVGFPELNCNPNEGFDCKPDAFKNLVTTVNGKGVVHEKGRISSTHEWSNELGTVWLFDASFAPNQATRISHSYQVFTGGNLSWIYDIHYLVKTGRGWAGKIGAARFRVKLPPAAHTVTIEDYPHPPRFVADGTTRPYFLLERTNTDWVPPATIGMAFIFTSWSDISERLGADRFARSGVKEEEECVSPVAPETAAQARMCKNLIYAISGYPFKSEKLQKYFYGNQFDWRRAKYPGLDDVWMRGLRPFQGFEPSWIPALDRSFLRHIEGLEFKEGSGEEHPPPDATQALSDADARADDELELALSKPGLAGPAAPRSPERPVAAKVASATSDPGRSSSRPAAREPRAGSCSCSSAPGTQRSMPAIWVSALTLALSLARRRNTPSPTSPHMGLPAAPSGGRRPRSKDSSESQSR